MDWTNLILHLVFFALHLMMQPLNYCLGLPTLPTDENKRDFTPITISLGQSADTYPAISSQMTNTYDLLISIREVLSNLQLDANEEVLDSKKMEEDAVEDEDLR